jgi:hypothetical protein
MKLWLERLRLPLLSGRETPIASAKDVIGWWESRRIAFNLIVGAAGIFTCVLTVVVALGSEILFDHNIGGPDPPIFGLIWIAVYAVAANACFTGGWVAELLVRKLWPQESDRFATTTFATGLFFSVVLTLAPGLMIGAAGCFALLRHFLAHKP